MKPVMIFAIGLIILGGIIAFGNDVNNYEKLFELR